MRIHAYMYARMCEREKDKEIKFFKNNLSRYTHAYTRIHIRSHMRERTGGNGSYVSRAHITCVPKTLTERLF